MSGNTGMTPEQVKKISYDLETSPSCGQKSSPIYGAGKKVGKGTKMPASKKGIS